MSPLRLTGSTSGYSEINAPAVAGDQTFTLPGTGGTLDRLNRAGNILQVVQGSTSTEVTISTTTYTDTGLTATITPTSASSKVLVLVDQMCRMSRSSNSQYTGLRLYRDATLIHSPIEDGIGPYDFGIQANGVTAISDYSRYTIIYLDSPASTSSLVYKTQARPYIITSSGQIIMQPSGNINATSYLTLIEVAA